MRSKGILAARYIFWLLTVAVMGLIFFFSSQNGDLSSGTSAGFTVKLLTIFKSGFAELSPETQQELVASLQFVIRKCAHLSIFAALGASFFSAMCTYNIKWWLRFVITLPACVLYAVSDEFHQTFSVGRSGNAFDVMVDSLGSLTGVLFVYIVVNIYKAIHSRSKAMRKKDLMYRLSESVSAVERLHAENKSLRAEIETLKQRISELEQENVIEEVREETPVIPEPEGFVVKIVDEIDFDDSVEVDPPLANDMLEYGAGIIGRLTVEAAKVCDKITASGKANQKDMLGLIMGKSELCKGEILTIAMCDQPDDEKCRMIEAEFNEAIEYFNSVSQQ